MTVAALLLLACSAFLLCYVHASGVAAGATVERENPLAKFEVFARPLLLSTGLPMSPAVLESYLKASGSVSVTTSTNILPGAYYRQGDCFRIHPRKGPFFSAIVTFRGTTVLSVTDLAGKPLPSLLLEPPLIHTIWNDEDAIQGHSTDRLFSSVGEAEFEGSLFPDAIIVKEDKRFDDHDGIDLYGWANRILKMRGLSSISAQVARTILLKDRSRSVSRKFKELLYAIALKRRFGRQAILRAYANSVYCGSIGGTKLVGVKAAAIALFGKYDLRTLTPGETVTIVSLFSAPNPRLAEYRGQGGNRLTALRQSLLKALFERRSEHRTPEEMHTAIADFGLINTDLTHVSRPQEGFREAWTQAAQDLRRLARRSPRVYLTLDWYVQQSLQSAIDSRYQIERRIHGALPADFQFAGVVVSPLEGEVLAWVGGRGGPRRGLDRVLQPYPVASLTKPVLAARALEVGTFEMPPLHPLSTIDLRANACIQNFCPADHTADRLSLLAAVARSSNRLPLALANRIGLENSRRFLGIFFGHAPKLDPPFLIGGASGSEISPLDVALSYSAFSNQGLRYSRRLIWGLGDDRTVGPLPAPTPTRVLESKSAFMTLQIMRATVGDIPLTGATMGRYKALAGLGPEHTVAAKTGSGSVGALWATVLHPKLTFTSVAACDRPCPLSFQHGYSGGQVSGLVWVAFARDLLLRRPDLFVGAFSSPKGLITSKVNLESSCLDPSARSEISFVPGALPPQCDVEPAMIRKSGILTSAVVDKATIRMARKRPGTQDSGPAKQPRRRR